MHPTREHPKNINHVLTDIKEEINTTIIIDFNTPFTLMGTSSIQKIKETVTLNDILDQMKLTSHIFRTFYQKTARYTYFQVHIEHSPEKITC